MSTFIPITLVGNHLGERHHYLNSLVAEAHRQGIPFEAIRDVPEQSPVDRLFKIELASHHRDVDYIIRNLKDEDMLYVSKALKSLWLLDAQYSDIINPVYLEDVLFPEMLTTAVNKTRHWIHLHLRDEQRCQEFYIYYKEKDFRIAMQFLKHCKNEFILNDVMNIIHMLTPQHLKLLSEKCPQIAKLFFDNLNDNAKAVKSYLNSQHQYYNNLSCVLKLNADVYLDIIEQYFNQNSFSRLSFAATRYIMKHKRSRFFNKPELYTAWLLNIEALAKSLTHDEIKEIVLKLARAQYLNNWFSYKNVELLINRLNFEDRALFKKQVFVDRCVGEIILEWPYPLPCPPNSYEQDIIHIFVDTKHHISVQYVEEIVEEICCVYTKSKMKKCSRRIINTKTLLDKLFDEYRFVSFERTLYELRKRMATESNPQSREYMMLVLVSKSGGRADAVEALMRFLVERHSNEPCTVRAAVVRSLVRRAAAWRLPPVVWELLVQFAQGLGLDGGTAKVACREGIHAVVLRVLLNEPQCKPNPAVLAAYFDQFSPLAEYALNPRERRLIGARLPALLLVAARDAVEPTAVAEQIERALDTLDEYTICVEDYPDVVVVLAELATRDAAGAAPLLSRLFEKRVARRQLFRENFRLVRTDESYVNALRHDAAMLDEQFDLFKELVSNGELRHERFLRKLSLYFGEENGLAARHLFEVESIIVTSEHATQLARPMALLAGGELATLVHELDSKFIDLELKASSQCRRLAAALRAHAHVARPPLDLAAFGWRAAGVKAVANRVLVCSSRAATEFLRMLLSDRRWTRLALTLALRCGGEEVPAFEVAATLRPGAALAVALRYLRRRGDTADARIWRAVRPLLTINDPSHRFDLAHSARDRLRRSLIETEHIPRHIKVDYIIVVYNAFNKISSCDLWRLVAPIEILLPEIDMEFIVNLIKEFLNEVFLEEKIKDSDDYFRKNVSIYMSIIGKCLLLSHCNQAQENTLNIVGELFFKHMQDLWDKSSACNVPRRSTLLMFIDDFLHSLKYSEVFLDVSYTSCIPVFERVIKWLQGMLPIEKWFDKYVCIHLTMLYFKTIRQSIKQRPEVFADEDTRLKEGVEIVGMIFGKYIAREISELIDGYFSTIVEIYKSELLSYFRNYFPTGDSTNMLKLSVIRGLLGEVRYNGSGHLAEYIFKEEFKYHTNRDTEEIVKTINDTQNSEIQFFLYGDLNSYI